MWCNPCRAVGMIHCAHPDECGNMLSDKAAADNWKTWLDDLPLDAGFAEGIGRVQGFISGTVARAEAAEAQIAALTARVEGLTDCRKWDCYPIEMPLTKDGHGPAIPGRDEIACITYEVWDRALESHASFDNLPDAINEAMRLSLAALSATTEEGHG